MKPIGEPPMGAVVGALVGARVSVPVVCVVAAGTFAGVVVQRPVAIPLSDTAELLWPVACLVALPAAVWLHDVGGRWLEAAAGRGRRFRVALVASILLVVVGAVGCGVGLTSLDGGAPHAGEVCRNFGLVLGVTLLLGHTPARDVLWAPGLLGVMACWVLGTSPAGLGPAGWALTMRPIGDVGAGVVSGTALVAGVAAYVVDPFSDRSC